MKMVAPTRCGLVLIVYFPLIALLLLALTQLSEARELRPSEHGLTFQSPPATAHKSSDMASFFQGSASAAPSTSKVPLPEAKNMSDPSWLERPAGEGLGPARGRRGESHDRVRNVLLVASLVCGITGVTLLVAATFLFIFRHRSSPNNGSGAQK